MGLSPKRAVAVGTQAGLGSSAFAVQVSLAGSAECSRLKFSQDPRKTEKNVIFSLVNFFFICFKESSICKAKGHPKGVSSEGTGGEGPWREDPQMGPYNPCHVSGSSSLKLVAFAQGLLKNNP